MNIRLLFDTSKREDIPSLWDGLSDDERFKLLNRNGILGHSYRKSWSELPEDLKEEITLIYQVGLDSLIYDAVTLTHTSSDEDQLEAYESLLAYLQPIYYPMFKDEVEDLAQDFWEFMNSPIPYTENVSSARNVPSTVKVWAIRWLQNLNRSKHHNSVLSARMREELNRAEGHIALSDYITEAYNRIFTFTEKELVSFIRKFKELMKTEKGIGYALSPDQIDMFKPLFEKAQFLLAEMRTPDCKSVVSAKSPRVVDADSKLTDPLLDILGTLFYEVDGSDLQEV